MLKLESVLPPRRFSNSVATLGNFDGVHLGHQKIFAQLVQRADILGSKSIVYTFRPHPVKILHPDRHVPLITTDDDRARLIEGCGVDVLICAPFDRAFARQDAKDFVENVLVRALGVGEVLVGYDYGFGRERQGDNKLLQEMGEALGFQVRIIPPVTVDGVRVSSRKIRSAVQEGDMILANRMLGREFTIEGVVQPGHHRGKTLGYPTANLTLRSELLPRTGVYAVRVYLPGDGQTFCGMANFGTNPTFGDERMAFEVHLFDFAGDLCDQKMHVALVERLRDEARFDSPRALVEQLRIDESMARSLLSR